MSLFSVNLHNPPTSQYRNKSAYSFQPRQWIMGSLLGVVFGCIFIFAGGAAIFIHYMNPYRTAMSTPDIQYQNEKAEINLQLHHAIGNVIEQNMRGGE
ncbi:MAG: hypothetical protein ABIE07_01285 [Candidatus Zixiibacteriota bacterium]